MKKTYIVPTLEVCNVNTKIMAASDFKLGDEVNGDVTGSVRSKGGNFQWGDDDLD